jgi:hypothetical protein
MFKRLAGTCALLALGLVFGADQAAAQIQVRVGDSTVRIGGRLHAQYATTSVEDYQPSHNFFIRRARLNVDIAANDWIDARLQTEYVLGVVDLLDAYVRLKFNPWFQVSTGQFKRAFDLFELESSTQLAVIERGGRIPGLEDECAGVGRACSYSRLSEALYYSNRDMGVRVAGGGDRFSYMATVTNGETLSQSGDNNGAKSWAVRATYNLLGDLTLGGGVSAHDYYVEEVGDEYGMAWGADLEWGGYTDGLHLQWAIMGGDNWRNLDDEDDPSTFLTSQALVSWFFPTTGKVVGLEPVFRVSYGDADTDADEAGGWLYTPGVSLYFGGRNRFSVNWDFYAPDSGDSQNSLKAQMYFYF